MDVRILFTIDAPAFAVQLHSIDIQIGDFDAIFVIYALITSLMGIKSFDLLFTHRVSVKRLLSLHMRNS